MDRRLQLVALTACGLVISFSAIAEQPRPPSRGVQIVVDSGGGEQTPLYGDSYALLIGVSRYTGGWQNLESIHGELDSVAAALRIQGFEVQLVRDPDADALEEAFEDFIGTHGYAADDRLLIFFAGHGHTRNNGKKAYLVPADAPLPHDDEAGFLRKALPMSQIVQWAREMETKHALFLFDSCFSGTIFKSRDLPAVPAHITAAAAKPVRQFITAGGADQPVPARRRDSPGVDYF